MSSFLGTVKFIILGLLEISMVFNLLLYAKSEIKFGFLLRFKDVMLLLSHPKYSKALFFEISMLDIWLLVKENHRRFIFFETSMDQHSLLC